MHGLETIKAMNAEAAEKARSLGKKPYCLVDETVIDSWPAFPFPDLGDACADWDEVYRRVDTLFCDASGCGSPEEPALTADQLKERVFELWQNTLVGQMLYIAIEEVGQFQLHLAVWRA